MPSAKVSDKVALSPSVIVSRSNAAVNVAAPATDGASQTTHATQLLANRSQNRLRLGTSSLNCDNTLRMVPSADFCLHNRTAQASRHLGVALRARERPLA